MAKKKSFEVQPLLEDQGWYQQLLETCEATIVESVMASNWALIEGYHSLGGAILAHEKQFKKLKVTNYISRIAEAISKSPRTIQRSTQFYRKYPDLALLPEGKNVTWHSIVNKYLPETTKEKEPRTCICFNFLELDAIVGSLLKNGFHESDLYTKLAAKRQKLEGV